jgi:RHS repeat-associated protein
MSISAASNLISQFTGKERDAETGLDYFTARYLSAPQGRFMSPDPLFIEQKRLADPQRLNLYAYVRNNPLRFSDPTGMAIQMNCETERDCLLAAEMINGRENANFKVSVKDGHLEIIAGSVAQKLSDAEQALYNAIVDDSNIAVLNVFENTGKAEFGVYNSNGENTIDLGNLSKLGAPGNNGGLRPGDVASHEALEAYRNLFTADAHTEVAKLFPGLGPETNKQFLTRDSGNLLVGMQFQQAISDGRGTMGAIVSIVTPIPAQSLSGKSSAERIRIIEDAPKRFDSITFTPKP